MITKWCSGGSMHKIVFILLAFFAVVTFIRAFDSSAESHAEYSQAMITISPSQ
jgi:hypothetical protein